MASYQQLRTDISEAAGQLQVRGSWGAGGCDSWGRTGSLGPGVAARRACAHCTERAAGGLPGIPNPPLHTQTHAPTYAPAHPPTPPRPPAQALLTQPSHCLPFLRAGRLVRVSSGGVDWGTGVVVSVMRRPDAAPAAEGEVRQGRGRAAWGSRPWKTQ